MSRTKSGILNFSLKQVVLWLTKEWAKDNDSRLFAKIVGNKRFLRQLEASLDSDNEAINKTKLEYPYLTMCLAEMSLDEELGALRKNRSTGGYISRKNLELGITYEDVRRIRVGLGCLLKTDNLEDVISLAHILLYNAPKVGFIMRGEAGFTVETSITIDNSISIPETTNDSGEYYEYEFVLVLKTYLGYVRDQKIIKSVKFNQLDADNEELFFEGSPHMDLSRTISYTDYYNKDSPLFRGQK